MCPFPWEFHSRISLVNDACCLPRHNMITVAYYVLIVLYFLVLMEDLYVVFCFIERGGVKPPTQWARAFSFTRFLDHTQRRTTVGRTPLDESSARRRDLYLMTHNTRYTKTSTPQAGFESIISAGERSQTYALDRAPLGQAYLMFTSEIICSSNLIKYLVTKWMRATLYRN